MIHFQVKNGVVGYIPAERKREKGINMSFTTITFLEIFDIPLKKMKGSWDWV